MTQAPSTAEQPWPVRLVSSKIAEWVARLGSIWVEGQVVQLSRRPGTSMAFLVLRDTDADFSLQVTCTGRMLDALATPLSDGARVVMHAKPTFWTKRGTLQLQADDIRPVGIGELLARIEHLKRVLAAEGLFAPDRKVPLPFAPLRVGLICGRESKAEHDVVVNARSRWPHVEFEIREVAVQGVNCVPEVTAALAELDADPSVEVIVIARGGGAVEDLLPFSNEALVRAAAACLTPLISAIGHETDCPLLDLVADYRASTPTDAAKRLVPDMAEERSRLSQARGRMDQAISSLVAREQQRLDAIRSRPVLANPTWIVDTRQRDLTQVLLNARTAIARLLERGSAEIARLSAQVTALSPQATLDRGYAVVREPAGAVVRDASQVKPGQELDVRVAHGSFPVQVTSR